VNLRKSLTFAVLGAVLVAVAPAATAAVAAVAKPTVELDHVVLKPGGDLESPYLALRRTGGASIALHDLTVDVVVGSSSGFATVEPMFGREDCTTPTPNGFSCKLDDETFTGNYLPLIPLTIQSMDTAVPGDIGTIIITVRSREFGALVRRSTVTIAETVAFQPGAAVERTAKPGQRVNLPLSLRNTGDRPITSVVMQFFREELYTYPQSFKNCQYSTDQIFCRFDDDIPVGATYRLSTPLAMVVNKQLPAPGFIGQSFHWGTPADMQNDLEGFKAEKPKKGTGTTLRLVPTSGSAAPPSGAPEVPQSDGSTWFFKSQDANLTLSGRNVADLAAVGADVRGGVKKTVAVRVGAQNLGTALIFGLTEPAAKVVVTRPKGTTVVAVPTGCLPSAKGKVIKKKDPRGNAEYLCSTTVSHFKVGQKITWVFKLRIDKKGALTGSVRVVPSTVDGKRTNDTAKLRVNPPKKK
jgi:hypothetical protein